MIFPSTRAEFSHARIVSVELNRQCYRVLGDSDPSSEAMGMMYESFEQLVKGIMGDQKFSDHLLHLMLSKLNSNS